MATPSPVRPLFISTSTICHTCRRRLTLQLHQQTPRQQPTQHPSTVQFRSYANRKGRQPTLMNASATSTDDSTPNLPRWAATPSAMQAPFRTRPRNDNDEFPVNEDPASLHKALSATLGSDEAAAHLPEALRWLAVTHKSFDHGRRGYNARLAFLGKRLVAMDTSLALLDAPSTAQALDAAGGPDAYGRVPFTHRALMGLERLGQTQNVLGEDRIARLARGYGLHDVIRWKPRLVRDLKASGIDVVLETTMYAIVGAVALQQGGEVARQMVRQRILTPLGV